MNRLITPRPLTRQAFAPFGEVIEADPAKAIAINYGATTRFDDLARIDVADQGGRPAASLFRSTPLPRPIPIKVMERHPLGSQAFIPLSSRPFVVVVGHPGAFDPHDLHVFLAAPHQGVNYGKGTWHHYSLALGEVSDFLVIDRAGPGDNLDEVYLSEADQALIDV